MKKTSRFKLKRVTIQQLGQVGGGRYNWLYVSYGDECSNSCNSCEQECGQNGYIDEDTVWHTSYALCTDE